jgi:hypothetical protein
MGMIEWNCTVALALSLALYPFIPSDCDGIYNKTLMLSLHVGQPLQIPSQ